MILDSNSFIETDEDMCFFGFFESPCNKCGNTDCPRVQDGEI